jgi:hypothetical protein
LAARETLGQLFELNTGAHLFKFKWQFL